MARHEARTPPIVPRPWGGYALLRKSRTVWVKKLYLRAGARTSLQSHRWRSEVWYVLHGKVDVQLAGVSMRCSAGDTVVVPRGRRHRLAAVTDACLLEVAFGKALERDIVRHADDYGRARGPRPTRVRRNRASG